MPFDPTTAAIRFGCGLSPDIAAPTSPDALLAEIAGPDRIAAAFPVEDFDAFLVRMADYRDLVRARRRARGTDDFEVARKATNVFRRYAREDRMRWLGTHILRRTHTRQGLRERMVGFWADHFTAMGKGGVARFGTTPYVETAIRPHIAGRFEDLLIAAVTAPLMLMYLDQDGAMGPNSEMGLRRQAKGRTAGLNENLAREVLELHTLGAQGPYTQADVRQLAELFTGMSVQAPNGFNYRKPLAEPGAETILGRTYGGGNETFAAIDAALRDLARHPATARHIASKLATHFVSDTPDPELVRALETRFLDTGGDLYAVTEAMLAHPTAWDDTAPNVKQPFDFIASACRALGVAPHHFDRLDEREMLALIRQPMAQMGQNWEQPPGPDGLPEEDTNWITAQGLAARLRWAVSAPTALTGGLPDPREFVETALGPRATEAVRFAARAAESRAEGIGLILCSPAFQRL
ncbi:DUF1800 domain-containing protein [Pseudaestuariivita sp.]|uniref:DUF1800 domain-containing protein n=1 Tax=Pseudaestuariivita sp. TaxID=2211669 RepID=UPI00405A45B4